MQNEPEKTAGNYNELTSSRPFISLPGGVIELLTEAQNTTELQQLVQTGIGLVNQKVDQILGNHNRLTSGQIVFPKINFVQTDPEQPNCAGYFQSGENSITLVADKIKDDPRDRTKVFIHEYIHFLCHNGRDDTEEVNSVSPIAQGNNIGFSRNFGIDIRESTEGALTGDYFLSFNEAVTEQLAIDILPGVHETYSDYRGLLNQVIDDAVVLRLGLENENGIFTSWSREQVKNYIYECFFRGDIAGFTKLLQTTYKKYDISEQQFGLMTRKDDLPSVIEKAWYQGSPNGSPPSPAQVVMVLQQRLNKTTTADYVSDVISPTPNGDAADYIYGTEYDNFVAAGVAMTERTTILDGFKYNVDNSDLIVYRGDAASKILDYITEMLDTLVIQLRGGEIDAEYLNQEVDRLLFNTYKMSMLSDGFRDFYVYKHTQIDTLK